VQNLTIVIILPIVGFLILVALLSFCCFCLVRHRRKLAKKRSQSHHLRARWDDTTISTPWAGGDGAAAQHYPNSPYRSPGMTNSSLQPMITPPVGSGFHVVDYDGQQYEAGYSSMKTGGNGGGVVSYVAPVSPPLPVSVPRQAFHLDQQTTSTSPQGRALSKQEEELQQYQLYHLQQAQQQAQQQQAQQQYQQQQAAQQEYFSTQQQRQSSPEPQIHFPPPPGATSHAS
jgi:hypothetical protein